MGWGTFIVGQAIGSVRRAGRKSGGGSSSSALQVDFENLAKRRQIFEQEVLKEIQRLKAEGQEVDLKKVRAEMYKTREAYEKLGPFLDMQITRIAQQKALAGEPVDEREIEREIIANYKPFPWGQVLLWIFFPYVPAAILLSKWIKSRKSQD
jgi:hypothetical protein